MILHATQARRVSLLFALLVSLLTLFGSHSPTLAAGPRILTLSDMSDFSGAEGANNNTIAGATYKYAILLADNHAYVTILPHAFPGYAAFTTAVGVEDGDADNHPGTATLVVTVDGRRVKTIAKVYDQAATTLTVPFGQASQIKLTLVENQPRDLYLLLGNPAVVPSIPKPIATPPSFGSSGYSGKGAAGNETTLKMFSASVTAGSQETALITTGANAVLTVVIRYPGGSQQVVGPRKAGADGHFAYSWTVPRGVTGLVRVVVVSSSVVQATFTIQ
jgi:hypothetical protein